MKKIAVLVLLALALLMVACSRNNVVEDVVIPVSNLNYLDGWVMYNAEYPDDNSYLTIERILLIEWQEFEEVFATLVYQMAMVGPPEVPFLTMEDILMLGLVMYWEIGEPRPEFISVLTEIMREGANYMFSVAEDPYRNIGRMVRTQDKMILLTIIALEHFEGKVDDWNSVEGRQGLEI
ncbi:MAG: hypothetical protein FWC79_02320 [Oscillospiraceae bacterium]|nr:hypothetical protein [Oscillospiraceae bacterium]